ncbi:MAG: glutathione S-transferase family protein [Gammaproteobacteria bacterium]|nr:glutathione S-transferase family protein [Gammaproteobacteria bacterium]
MSTPKLHLISHLLCPFVQRARIVLAEKAITYDMTFIDLKNKPDWFLALSPLGRVPVLEVNQRDVLFESAVITEYLDEITPPSLHPADPLEKAKQRAWIEYASTLLGDVWVFFTTDDLEKFSAKQQLLQEKLQVLELVTQATPFFAGGHFQLVDAVYATVFRYFDFYKTVAHIDLLQDFDALKIWSNAVLVRPSVQHAVPDNYIELLKQDLQNRRALLANKFQ